MLDGSFKDNISDALSPVGRFLSKIGISAHILTFLGLIMSIICMFYIAAGNLRIGFIFFILTGLSDLLDGPVAKAAGSTSDRGAFYDSLADRISDALIFSGLIWHISREWDGQLFFLPLSILLIAQLVSYERAKAESLGLHAKGGLMERAERFIVLGFGLIFEDWLIQILWVMLGLMILTALHRFIKILFQINRRA